MKPFSAGALAQLRKIQKSNLRTDDIGQKRTRSICFLDTSVDGIKKNIAKFNGKRHPHVVGVQYYKADLEDIKQTANHLQGMIFFTVNLKI